MNVDNKFRLDQWLNREMRERGWNSSDLARASGVSKVSIGLYIANERMPNLYSFQCLLRALGKHMVIEDNR